MDASFSVAAGPREWSTLYISLPPTRLGVAAEELEGYSAVVFDQVAGMPWSTYAQVEWGQESFQPDEQIRMTVRVMEDELRRVQKLGQAVIDAFQVTDANAASIASGLTYDGRKYLNNLSAFPKVLMTSKGPVSTWVITAHTNTELLSSLLQAHAETYRAFLQERKPIQNLPIPTSFAQYYTGTLSEREFLIFAGPNQNTIYGLLHGRELVRGWPIENISRRAREYPSADFSAYFSIGGVVSIDYVEAARPGLGIGKAFIKAFQDLPYEIIELEEGIYVPDSYYEKMGFIPSSLERAYHDGQFVHMRAMTYAPSIDSSVHSLKTP